MLTLLLATAAFAAQDVTVETSDGLQLHALVHGEQNSSRGVVLVHMEDRKGSDWSFVAERLGRSGMRTIAPDLRGHGTSPGADQVNPDDFLPMMEDVRASVAWLRAQGIEDVSCAGAGIGANLCIRVASEDPQISNLVLLSPGLKVKGVGALDVVEAYGGRPILLVASSDDRYSAISAEKLEARAKGQKQLEMLAKAGHGTKMLTRDPALEGIVIEWLLGQYTLASGEAIAPKDQLQSDVNGIQTTGRTLDSREK